jgi:hypothetical protein
MPIDVAGARVRVAARDDLADREGAHVADRRAQFVLPGHLRRL